MKSSCVFCQIIAGNVPAKVLYKDDLIHVLLDGNPVTKGHLLVIPTLHYQDIFDTPEVVLLRSAIALKRLSTFLKEHTNAEGVNILNASGVVAQQSVFHLHFHLVPRFSDDALNLWFHQEAKGGIDLDTVFHEFQKTNFDDLLL